MPTESQLPDGALVASVLSGETEPFAELVRRYQSALFRLAWNRLGPESAEDVVQETFLCAYKSLATYDSRYSFRTWLWTILINQCRRQLKRGRRSPQVLSWSDQPDHAGSESPVAGVDPSPSPADHLLAKERAIQLAELLNQLPEAQADAMRLRFFGELKFQEIADAMQCSLSSAKARVRRGLVRLSDLMESESAGRQACVSKHADNED